MVEITVNRAPVGTFAVLRMESVWGREGAKIWTGRDEAEQPWLTTYAL